MVVQFIVFLTLSTLICRGMDISKCFSESFRIRDNESRLYMGKLFTPKLVWINAKEELAAQAKRTLFNLYNVQNKLGTFSATEVFKLFDTMITPILTYAAEIWGYDFLPQIKKKYMIDFAQIS